MSYRVQYVDSSGVLRDQAVCSLREAEIALQAAVTAGARQATILRDVLERETALGVDYTAGEYWD